MKRKLIVVAICMMFGLNVILPISMMANEGNIQENVKIESTSGEKAKTPDISKTAEILSSNANVFTENRGQWDSSILFVGITSFGRVVFTNEAIWYEVQEWESNRINEESTINYHYLSLSFQTKMDHQLIMQGLTPVEYVFSKLKMDHFL